MWKPKPVVAFVFGVLLYVAYLDAQTSKLTNKPDAAPAPSKLRVDPEQIRAHVEFLSSDLLEGRGTGRRPRCRLHR
jgi:hypothetical protein